MKKSLSPESLEAFWKNETLAKAQEFVKAFFEANLKDDGPNKKALMVLQKFLAVTRDELWQDYMLGNTSVSFRETCEERFFQEVCREFSAFAVKLRHYNRSHREQDRFMENHGWGWLDNTVYIAFVLLIEDHEIMPLYRWMQGLELLMARGDGEYSEPLDTHRIFPFRDLVFKHCPKESLPGHLPEAEGENTPPEPPPAVAEAIARGHTGLRLASSQ